MGIMLLYCFVRFVNCDKIVIEFWFTVWALVFTNGTCC